MLNKKIKTALDEQIGKEAYSVALYEKMSVCTEIAGYINISKYCMKKADEEKTHYRRFIEYVQDRAYDEKGEAIIPAVKEPEFEFKNIKGVFEAILAHEQMITASINDIAKLCVEEGDFVTFGEMQWFLHEQIEEEKSIMDYLAQLELTPPNSHILFDGLFA